MREFINVAGIFGENVFNDTVMRERLPKSVYKKLRQTIEDGSELDPSIADVVAQAAILAEGDAAKRDDIIFLEELPLFFH